MRNAIGLAELVVASVWLSGWGQSQSERLGSVGQAVNGPGDKKDPNKLGMVEIRRSNGLNPSSANTILGQRERAWR